MYKIGVIGDRQSVLGFKAVGLSVFPADDGAEARKLLSRIAKENYAIIYITENLCKDLREDLDRYAEHMLPAVIPIPGMDGSLGIGIGGVKRSVERAVGADILFGGD